MGAKFYRKLCILNVSLTLGKACRTGAGAKNLRFFNVYGPGQDLNRLDQGIVSIFLSMLLDSPEIISKGSIKRVRDVVHIKDVVKALLASMDTNFSGPQGHRFTGTAKYLLGGKEISLLRAGAAGKRTKMASLDTNIGKIDVAVYDVGDRISHLATA